MLSFFQRDVLDEILDLIESFSEGFPTYSWYDSIEIFFVSHLAIFSNRSHLDLSLFI